MVAMLLDIIYEDMHLNGDGGEHFNCETLRAEYIHLQRYLEQCIAPFCAHIGEDIKNVEQVGIELLYTLCIRRKTCRF